MAGQELIDALEAAPDRRSARRTLRGQPLAGLPELAFSRIAELSGRDPLACVQLSKRLDLLIDQESTAMDRAYFLRSQGVGFRCAGRWQSAAESFIAAGEELDGADRWGFSIGAIDSLARAGKVSMAEDYARLVFQGSQNALLTARACLSLANVYNWQDRHEEAVEQYRAALDGLPDAARFEQAAAHLGISTALLLINDLGEAAEHAEIAVSLFESLGSSYHASLGHLNLAQVELLSGRPDDAVRLLLDLRVDLMGSPPDAMRIAEFLGDAYLRLNLRDEATHAYREALASPVAEDMPLNQANCRYGLAVAERLANPREAARQFRNAARTYRRLGNRAWEYSAMGNALLLGSTVPKTQQVRALINDLDRCNAHFLREELELQAAYQNLIDDPRPPESPLLEWRFAWWQARKSRTVDSFRKMFDLIDRDRIAISTPSASLRFFDERGLAVIEFIELLLERGDAEEAMNVIARTRSSALIDEIIASRSAVLGDEAIAALDDLRSEILQEGTPGTRLRRSGDTRVDSRKWIESTWAHKTRAAKPESDAFAGDLWFQGKHQLTLIRDRTINHAQMDVPQLRKRLDWLEFYLLEPMLNPRADHQECADLIATLAAEFAPSSNVCPDGDLWRVPWTLLTHDEVILQLSPGFGAKCGSMRLPDNPKVAIWAAQAPDLPSIQSEIEAISTVFPEATVLTDRGSVRSSYLEDFDLLHIAGHARINRSTPAFSYIEFSDGPLYAAEIARSGLRARLAVVAVCQSGLSAGYQATEPEGIVRSFLACGAQAAVGSLWPIDDRFTFGFMSQFYSHLQHHDLLTSMKLARRVMRDEFPHPYYWGSLALFGGYQSS